MGQAMPLRGSGLEGVGRRAQGNPFLGAAGGISARGGIISALNGQAPWKVMYASLGGHGPTTVLLTGGPEQLHDLSKATQHC
jgi:hypothetical protein